MITASQLIASGVGPTQAHTFAEPLSMACDRFQIDTPGRIAAFLGQCMVESGLLVHTEENLFYSSPERIFAVFPSHFKGAADAAAFAKNPAKLANRVYANRLGNGDEASGDGFRYRGRGLLQVTGRDAYADCENGLAHGFLAHPELMALPPDACLAAGWYWHCRKLNTLADAGNVDGITRAVNGRSMLDAARRRQYTQQALAALQS